MRRILLLVACLLALPVALSAQGIRVTVDRAEVTLEDQIVLSVTVEGSRNARPQLPELEAFEVAEGGQSTQVQIVNGRMTANVSYSYLLTPKRVGSFLIGPATVELDGRSYQSRPFTVKVLDPGNRPRESRELYLTTQVSSSKPYVGEQVVYTWRFFRRVQVADASLEPQDFGGLLVEDLGELREYETMVRGQSYLVSEIRKALFPQEPGTVTVPASRLHCQVVMRSSGRGGGIFDDFFSRPHTAAKVLRGDPITLEVRPRPAPPRGFSGLVGSFGIQAELSNRDLSVGESATLEVTISGTGNAQMISAPAYPDFEGFKVYDDQPTTSLRRQAEGLKGSKSFHRAVVPLAPGEPVVPAIPLTFFDPSSGSYRTVSTDPIRLAVRPSEGREELHLTESLAPTTGKVSVRILADDILPVRSGPDVLRSSLPRLTDAMLLGGLLAPPLLFLAITGLQRRRTRLATDRGYRRRRQAARKARAALDKALAAASPGQRAEGASRALRGFVGDALDLEGAALTPAEVEGLLREHRVPEETVQRVHRLLARLEEAHYGAGASPEALDRLLDGIEGLLRELDGRLRR